MMNKFGTSLLLAAGLAFAAASGARVGAGSGSRNMVAASATATTPQMIPVIRRTAAPGHG